MKQIRDGACVAAWPLQMELLLFYHIRIFLVIYSEGVQFLIFHTVFYRVPMWFFLPFVPLGKF